MPSVASEAAPVLPSRLHSPSARSRSEDREPATPFAEVLDGAVPAEPPPARRPARSERPERADAPKPKDEQAADAKSAQESTQDSAQATTQETAPKSAHENSQVSAQESSQENSQVSIQVSGQVSSQQSGQQLTDSDNGIITVGNPEPKGVEDTTDVITANTIAKANAVADDATSAEAGVKPKDQPKTGEEPLAALVDATTPAVTAPPPTVIAVVQPPAPTATEAAPSEAVPSEAATPEAAALVALRAAAGIAPQRAPKPSQPQAQGDKPADAPAAKAAAPAEPQAAIPQIDSAKDGQARGNGDKIAAEFHRAAAEILTKPEASAPSQQPGDAGAAIKASADAVQNLGLASPAHPTTTATPAANASAQAQPQSQAQPVAVPLSGLAVEITTQASAGNKHFEIRLDPPELGRIHVKLDVDRDGNVSTRLVVDRADTLDLLKRDASSLEGALQQSGLKTSDNALEFSLRQQGFARDETAAQTGAQLIIPDDDPAPLEAMRQGYGRLLGLGGGLDIRV